MLQHVSNRANALSSPLHTILQAAAGRAWARTRPVRNCHTAHRADQTLVVPLEKEEGESSQISFKSGLEPYNSQASVHLPSPVPRAPSASTFASKLVFSLGDVHSPHSDSISNTARQGGSKSEEATNGSNYAPTFKSRSVAPLVDPDLLPPEKIRYAPPSRVLASPDDEPSWSEVSRTIGRSSFLPKPGSALFKHVPRPSSPESLHENIRYLRSSQPPPSLPDLVRYHRAYPSYQSATTYNVLISAAIGANNLKTASRLFDDMLQREVDGDVETRRLWVRLAIRRGEWLKSWEEESVHGRMPLPVWLEFFRGVTLPLRQGHKKSLPGRSGKHSSDDPATEHMERLSRLGRIRTMLRTLQDEIIPYTEAGNVHPFVVHSIIQTILRMGGRAMAMDLTASYFQTLPPRLGISWRRWCLEIIHLHMLPGWKRGLAEHFCLRRVVYSYLAMHANFKPTATTLLLLLRPLRRTSQGGTLAWHLTKKFVSRWGTSVLSPDVLQRVASLATKEGRMDIVEAIMNAGDQITHPPRTFRMPENVVRLDMSSEPGIYWIRRVRRGRLRHSVRGWGWRLLRRRIWKRRQRECSECPDN